MKRSPSACSGRTRPPPLVCALRQAQDRPAEPVPVPDPFSSAGGARSPTSPHHLFLVLDADVESLGQLGSGFADIIPCHSVSGYLWECRGRCFSLCSATPPQLTRTRTASRIPSSRQTGRFGNMPPEMHFPGSAHFESPNWLINNNFDDITGIDES